VSEKANLFAIFSEPPPNFGLSKVKQMRAECKTKNEVFGFTYAECSQTYEKLVQGEHSIPEFTSKECPYVWSVRTFLVTLS
jgi:hypothetical protein